MPDQRDIGEPIAGDPTLLSDPAACRDIENVCRCGPRVLLALLEDLAHPDDVREVLRQYRRIPPRVIRRLGGGEIPGPMLCEVPE